MLSYADAETTLFRLHNDYGLAGVEVQRGAFRGRLKHLKRLGIPLGSRPGQGKKIIYSYEQIYQWAFCLEMEQFGIDPLQISDFMKFNWNTFVYKEAFRPAHDQLNQHRQTPGVKSDIFFYFTPNMMSSPWTDRGYPSMAGFGVLYEQRTPDLLSTFNYPYHRRCLLNVSAVVRLIATNLPTDHPDYIEDEPSLWKKKWKAERLVGQSV